MGRGKFVSHHLMHLFVGAYLIYIQHFQSSNHSLQRLNTYYLEIFDCAGISHMDHFAYRLIIKTALANNHSLTQSFEACTYIPVCV